MQETYPLRRTAGVVAFCVGLVALGLGFLVGGVRSAEPGDARWAVGGLGATFLLTGASTGSALVVRLLRAGPRPTVAVTGGVPRLLVPRSSLAAVGNVLLAVAVACVPAGFAVDLAVDGSPLGVAAMALPAAFFLTLPLFWALGRWGPGGLELTEVGIAQRRYGSRVRVAWDDVLALGPLPPAAQVDTTAAPVWVGLRVRRAEAAYTTPWFRNGRLPGDGEVALDLRDLGVHPAVLHSALEAWWRDPARRAEIGTPASLERLGVG